MRNVYSRISRAQSRAARQFRQSPGDLSGKFFLDCARVYLNDGSIEEAAESLRGQWLPMDQRAFDALVKETIDRVYGVPDGEAMR